MITTLINVQYNDRPDRRTRSALCLGHQGENGAREIIFNLADMISDYGPGTVTLLHMRGTDPAPYIIDEAAVTAAAPTVTWTISDTDTAAAGYGLMELRLAFNGESLAKSVLYGTVTYKALAGEIEIPDPLQSWYDALIEYIDEHGGGGGGAVSSVNGKTGIVVLDADDVGAGTYSKPTGGIPKTDLASAVQTSLGLADTALQSVPTTYRTASAQDTIDATKITAPSSPASGAFLVWNGSAWVAQTLATWTGCAY